MDTAAQRSDSVAGPECESESQLPMCCGYVRFVPAAPGLSEDPIGKSEYIREPMGISLYERGLRVMARPERTLERDEMAGRRLSSRTAPRHPHADPLSDVRARLTPRQTIRVLLADDHELYRAGVRSLLNERPEISVVDEVGSPTEIAAAVSRSAVDVVVTAFHGTESQNGYSIAALKAAAPEVAVVVLTTEDDEQAAARAISDGADAYVLKDSSLELIVHAIYAAHAGITWIQPELVRRLALQVQQMHDRGFVGQTESSLASRLTARELEVLRLWATNASTKEIADRLFISRSTVRAHAAHILHKTGRRNRVDAVHLAIREGLADP